MDLEQMLKGNTPTSWRVWLAAIRPRTLGAAVGPVILGAGFGWRDGVQQLWPAGLALLAAVLIQIGANLANDLFDGMKGTDTEARLGPPRALQRGWLTARQIGWATLWVFLAATVVGVLLVLRGGLPIVAIGIASIASGLAYTGGSRPYGYRGWGDVAVFVFFGPVAVCGTYYVQTLRFSGFALVASFALGALSAAILVVNNIRDRATDEVAGKRTLAVRFGLRFSRLEYGLLLGTAYAVPVVLSLLLRDWLLLLPLTSLPFAGIVGRRVCTMDGRALNLQLAQTAQLTLVFGALFGLGAAL